jgi:hypothetical protein
LIKEVYSKYTVDRLVELGFKTTVLGRVVRRGITITDISRATGRVRKGMGMPDYMTLNKLLKKLQIEQDPVAKIRIKWSKRIILREYKKVMARMREFGRNMEQVEEDPITFERIENPCFILKDWFKGCKKVYDVTTIERLKRPPEVYISHYADDTISMFVEQAKYISPYTRQEFRRGSVKTLDNF